MEPVTVTVSQLNNYMKKLVEHQPVLGDILIKGEISNYKLHYSGHHYITLKDNGGVLKAVMFKGAAQSLTFVPDNGMKVVARGKISVYEPGGTYQLYINEMTPDGLGELYAAFEKLKEKLKNEGYFDDEHKKPIPKYPKKVGIVTATTGAAIRDIINVITRRYPACEILIYPSLVQGPSAAANIAEGIEYFNKQNEVDTLIVGRGGGSIEDLWAFNEEIVAKAVYNSNIPIISAVGHETDFTICDFVADLRAPTPSAAAELAVPDCAELISRVSTLKVRLTQSVLNLIRTNKALISRLSLSSPVRTIEEFRQKTDFLFTRAEKAFMLMMSQKKEAFSKACAKLDAMSPLSVLSRGYSVAENKSGKVVKTTSDLASGDDFTLRLSDGKLDCCVK